MTEAGDNKSRIERPIHREPTPGTKAAKTVTKFREAGIECNMLDYDEGTHLPIFFGKLPEDEEEGKE